MNWEIKEHPIWGHSVFLDNGSVELGIPLDFGIRVGHLSLCGDRNVFYEQPREMKELVTEQGWRVRGGHRLWLAPESEKVYYPDNAPISYRILESGIELIQAEDPWLKVQKTMTLLFEEGSRVRVKHKAINTGDKAIRCSLWAVTCLMPGGTEYIGLKLREGGMDPHLRISVWDYTSLGDERAKYSREAIKIQHLPLKERFKIGVGHPHGPVRYEMSEADFVIHFPVQADKEYPDGNVSYETFLCRHMVEMESLSPYGIISPGESMEHQELWELIAKKVGGQKT